MDKQEMEAFINQQITGLVDFMNGYKACAKAVLEAFDKKEKDATGIQTDQGTAESA